MSLDLFSRLEYVDFLIRSKATGKPKELAEKLNLSERSLYDIIFIMKSLGAPIAYCRQKKTYYYSEDGSFMIRFQKEIKLENLMSFKAQLSKAVILCLLFFNLFVEADMLTLII